VAKPKGPSKEDKGPPDGSPTGFGHPPIDKRYQRGRSGNPAGRPKGRRNTANMTKDILNRPVRARMGDGPREMKAVEAIIRVLTNKATQGNPRSIALVNKLRDMAGLGEDLTDENRRDRTLRWPRSSTREEWDLRFAPARERDWQRFLAAAEIAEAGRPSDSTSLSSEIVPSAIRTGDDHAAQGREREAMAAYWFQLDLCKAQLGKESSDKVAQYNFRRSIMRAGLLADKLLRSGAFAQSIEVATKALEQSNTEYWQVPEDHHTTNDRWIAVVRAHARMLVGSPDEARTLYNSFDTEKQLGQTSFESAILREFHELKALGYSHPLMSEIEKRYADRGWARSMECDIPQRIKPDFRHAADIKSADTLAKEGRLDEAADTYQGVLSIGNDDVRENEPNLLMAAERYFVANRIGHLGRRFLLIKDFEKALSCVNEALAHQPNSTYFNLNRAHALMYLGQDDEANEIYFSYHGTKMSYHITQDVIRNEFKLLREALRPHRLMETVERRFKAAQWDVRMGVAGSEPVRSKAGYTESGIATTDSQASEPVHSLHAPVNRSVGSALPTPQDIPTGDRYLSEGKLNEAFACYQSQIKICDQILAKGITNLQASDTRHAAIIKISDVALKFLLARQPEQALAAVDYALSVESRSPSGNIRRAHVLLFLGKEDEARNIYLRHRGSKVSITHTAEGLVLEDFQRLRVAGYHVPLMDDIAAKFK
jgi:tetratricopeptide (TPR) repeat protein